MKDPVGKTLALRFSRLPTRLGLWAVMPWPARGSRLGELVCFEKLFGVMWSVHLLFALAAARTVNVPRLAFTDVL